MRSRTKHRKPKRSKNSRSRGYAPVKPSKQRKSDKRRNAHQKSNKKSFKKVRYSDLEDRMNIYKMPKPAKNKGKISFALISDLHIGSRFFEKNFFRYLMDYTVAAGFNDIYVGGDIIDSVCVYPNQENDLVCKTIDGQIDLAAKELSQFKSLNFYGIAGNHEVSAKYFDHAKTDPLGLLQSQTKNFTYLNSLFPKEEECADPADMREYLSYMVHCNIKYDQTTIRLVHRKKLSKKNRSQVQFYARKIDLNKPNRHDQTGEQKTDCKKFDLNNPDIVCLGHIHQLDYCLKGKTAILQPAAFHVKSDKKGFAQLPTVFHVRVKYQKSGLPKTRINCYSIPVDCYGDVNLSLKPFKIPITHY